MDIEINASDFKPYDVIQLSKAYGKADGYIIHGNIPEQVIIQASGNVTVRGNVGRHCSIEIPGAFYVRGRIADHVTLRASSIKGSEVGTHADFHARDGNIFMPFMGDHARLNATGNIHFDTGGHDLHAVAGSDIHFSKLGDDAILHGSSIIGTIMVGENGHLTATQGQVRVHRMGDGGVIFSSKPAYVNDKGKHVKIATYIPPPEQAPPVFKSTLTSEGCGIFKDALNKCYVIDTSSIEILGAEAMNALMEKLIDLDCSIGKGSATAPDGTSFEAHFVAFPHTGSTVKST